MASRITTVRSLINRLGSGPELPAFAINVGGLFLALVAAVCGFDLTAIILLLISIAGEWLFDRESPHADLLLQQANFGIPMRFALRVIAALVAASHVHSRATLHVFIAIAVVYAMVLCGRALHAEYRRVGPLKPMETRNIPGSPRIAEEPKRYPLLVTVTQLAVITPTFLGARWWLVAALGGIAVVALAGVTIPEARASWAMRMQKRRTGLTGPLNRIQEFVFDYRPEIIVHLSGPETAGYQINTWLESLESLSQHVLIVIRDAKLFTKLRATPIPSIQLRDAGELMMLDLAPAKIALYPSNTGNNIHLLRLPSLMSAFIGHGDSDKSASNNPFSRVYDELWVAGEAGADRYRKSNLGIHDDQYRRVGRPQVHRITRTPLLGEEEIPTILYAPTWEGVNLQQEYSSVSAVGIRIIEAMIAADPPVRIIYKPHPFTGQRDAKYRGVHARIVALIKAANAKHGTKHRVVTGGGGKQPTINECFNLASGLISDISSVVSDFLASVKPYAVFNHTDLDPATFVTEYPSTGAATVIQRDGSGIQDFIDVVTRTAEDTHAAARDALSTYLLGSPGQRTLESFQASVTAFIARSEAERSEYRLLPQSGPEEAELDDA